MHIVSVGLVALVFGMLAACSPKEEVRNCCAKLPTVDSAPQVAIVEPEYKTLDVAPENPSGGPQIVVPEFVAQAEACTRGLKARGLKPNELWLMANGPSGACPNNGVSEARLREILAKDWEAAGCKQNSKAEMMHALESGACGGDAG